MLTRKCKNSLKFLGTLAILVLYVTLDRYKGAATLGDNRNGYQGSYGTSTTATDKVNSVTVKTIVSYSREFKVSKVLGDQIECDASGAEPENATVSGDTTKWQHDRQLGIRLLSAYRDRREHPYQYVRIIGLVPRNLSLYCQVWQGGTRSTQKAIVHEVWSTSWGNGRRHCEETFPAIISCLLPAEATTAAARVSLVDRSCRGGQTLLTVPSDPSLSPERSDFVVCVKPLHFTHLDRKTFLEWTEINFRLGAEKIVVYTSESNAVNSAGGSGEKLVWREFVPPPEVACSPPDFEETTWHRRKMEIIAYNDCFYRNLNGARFVVPLDVDEIIVPKSGNSWIDAFRRSFPNLTGSDSFAPDVYASFSVRNAYFFSSYPKNAILDRKFKLPVSAGNGKLVPVKLVKNLGAWRKTKKTDSASPFSRTLRSYRLSPKSDSVKSFISVAKALSVFNHFAFHVLDDATGSQFIFPESVFLLNHYRNSCDPVLIDGCQDFLNHVIYDDSLEKFRTNPVPITNSQ